MISTGTKYDDAGLLGHRQLICNVAARARVATRILLHSPDTRLMCSSEVIAEGTTILRKSLTNGFGMVYVV